MKNQRMNSDLAPEEWMRMRKEKIRSDVLGSYTGLINDPDDKPVQDADDL